MALERNTKARETCLLSVNLQGVVSSLETRVEMLKADSGLDRNRAEFLAAMESDKVGSRLARTLTVQGCSQCWGSMTFWCGSGSGSLYFHH